MLNKWLGAAGKVLRVQQYIGDTAFRAYPKGLWIPREGHIYYWSFGLEESVAGKIGVPWRLLPCVYQDASLAAAAAEEEEEAGRLRCWLLHR